MMRVLTVWWEGAVVGSLTADRHGAMRFTYDADWLADPAAPALSVALPKRPEPYPPRQSRPFFEGLLPEGAQRDAVAAALGVSRANDFRLLDRLGGEVAGALSLCPAGETPPPPEATEATAALTDDELAALLATLDTRPFLAGTRGLRLSLAGAQSKNAGGRRRRTGWTCRAGPADHAHPQAADRPLFPQRPRTRRFAMRLAAGLGLEVAPVDPYVAAGRACLLVTRYDRRTAPDGTVRRLHQEDFCQALGVVFRPEVRGRRWPRLPAVLRPGPARLLAAGRRGAQAARRGHRPRCCSGMPTRTARTTACCIGTDPSSWAPAVRPALDGGLSRPVPALRHAGRPARHPRRNAAGRLGPVRRQRRTRSALRPPAGP